MMVKATECTDSMFASAAQRLADYVTPEKIAAGELYPQLCDLRDISLKVGAAHMHARAARSSNKSNKWPQLIDSVPLLFE